MHSWSPARMIPLGWEGSLDRLHSIYSHSFYFRDFQNVVITQLFYVWIINVSLKYLQNKFQTTHSQNKCILITLIDKNLTLQNLLLLVFIVSLHNWRHCCDKPHQILNKNSSILWQFNNENLSFTAWKLMENFRHWLNESLEQ